MKTLNNHLILYDAECPMCRLYTRAFQNTGMLAADGRAAYQEMPASVCPLVDRQRAVNEIALVNQATGEVTYGVESLFKVIGNAMPVFKPVFNFKPFVWLAKKAYSFISYNRRVIALAAKPIEVDVAPTFRLNMRLAYLFVAWLLVSIILTAYARLLNGVVPVGNTYREYLICGGQLIFQGIVVTLYKPHQRWDYLGHMMTISVAGALLLLPVLVASKFMAIPALFCTAYFMLVAGLMFAEHIRRSGILKLGWLLTATWTISRLVILFFILNF